MSFLPKVSFGHVGKKLSNWRKADIGNDDDEDIKTPKDVLQMLGFNPQKIKDK
jgi:hypothetical protein